MTLLVIYYINLVKLEFVLGVLPSSEIILRMIMGLCRRLPFSCTRARPPHVCLSFLFLLIWSGCTGSADDVVADDGRLYDTDRLMVLRAMLSQHQRATADGVPVNGYFYWSSQDNLEWNAGFGNRFGLVYVDFKTKKRIPKLSAEWFRETARWNAVV